MAKSASLPSAFDLAFKELVRLRKKRDALDAQISHLEDVCDSLATPDLDVVHGQVFGVLPESDRG